MTLLVTVEDVFLLLFSDTSGFRVDGSDAITIGDFYSKLLLDEEITEKQGRYILALIKKYKKFIPGYTLQTCEEILDKKIWRKPFRTIDLTKKVHIEIDEKKTHWVCLKMPYAIKDKFLERFDSPSHWDHNRALRLVEIYKINLIDLNDFLIEENFIIDTSFSLLLSKIEEIWNDQENIIPHCYIDEYKVGIKNVSEEAMEYFNSNKKDHISKDLILSKSMGLKLLKPTNKFDDIQKIAASSNFRFWIPDINKFVNLYRSTDGIVALIITKSVESITWLKEYLLQLKSLGITDDEIKICFRMDSVEDKSINFNNWIKEQSLVGDIRKGRLLVFANKPPKWLFKDNLSVTFIATNSLYPIPNIITQKWMDSHSCVLYLGEIKASQIKEKQIEQL